MTPTGALSKRIWLFALPEGGRSQPSSVGSARLLIVVSMTAAFAGGCVMRIDKYPPMHGLVRDASTGVAIASARVTACLLDRYPGAHQVDCESAGERVVVHTGSDGEFSIPAQRPLRLVLPVPHGAPGPYDVNLKVEKEGYRSRELDRMADHDRLVAERILVELSTTEEKP